MIGNIWTEIQQQHYNKISKDGENIHRWRRVVLEQFFELLKDLWRTRCGYLYAERTMTEKDMLTHRTYKLHMENNHKKELVSVLDRHLFDKPESYFFSSSKETLELWESKFNKAIKNIANIAHGQCILPTYQMPTPPTAPAELLTMQVHDMSFSQRIRRLDDMIQRTRNKLKHRCPTNLDPVWNKRLKKTHKATMATKRKRSRSQQRRKPRQRFVQLTDAYSPNDGINTSSVSLNSNNFSSSVRS